MGKCARVLWGLQFHVIRCWKLDNYPYEQHKPSPRRPLLSNHFWGQCDFPEQRSNSQQVTRKADWSESRKPEHSDSSRLLFLVWILSGRSMEVLGPIIQFAISKRILHVKKSIIPIWNILCNLELNLKAKSIELKNFRGFWYHT